MRRENLYLCVSSFRKPGSASHMTIKVDKSKKVQAKWRRQAAQHPGRRNTTGENTVCYGEIVF